MAAWLKKRPSAEGLSKPLQSEEWKHKSKLLGLSVFPPSSPIVLDPRLSSPSRPCRRLKPNPNLTRGPFMAQSKEEWGVCLDTLVIEPTDQGSRGIITVCVVSCSAWKSESGRALEIKQGSFHDCALRVPPVTIPVSGITERTQL